MLQLGGCPVEQWEALMLFFNSEYERELKKNIKVKQSSLTNKNYESVSKSSSSKVGIKSSSIEPSFKSPKLSSSKVSKTKSSTEQHSESIKLSSTTKMSSKSNESSSSKCTISNKSASSTEKSGSFVQARVSRVYTSLNSKVSK